MCLIIYHSLSFFSLSLSHSFLTLSHFVFPLSLSPLSLSLHRKEAYFRHTDIRLDILYKICVYQLSIMTFQGWESFVYNVLLKRKSPPISPFSPTHRFRQDSGKIMPRSQQVCVLRQVGRVTQISDPRFNDLRKNCLYIMANSMILQASLLSYRENK